MARGIITTNYSAPPGPGGLPVWVCSGWFTWDTQTIREIEQFMVYKYKIVPTPRGSDIVVMRLDGLNNGRIQTMRLNPRLGLWLDEMVKLGPPKYDFVAPAQTGGDYSGYEVWHYEFRFLQTTLNHFGPVP